ncbi:MAG: hypothetical protein ACXABY_17030, partial [Candidatus Thorarchaeota archaeon]
MGLTRYCVEDVAHHFPDHQLYGNEMALRECPNCKDDRYKFWVNPYKGVGHCFICEYAPRLETLIGYAKIWEELNDPIQPGKEDREIEMLPALTAFDDLDMLHPVFAFLSDRRHTSSVLDQYGVQYCHRGKHWKRIIFPFFGPFGEYRGFQGRIALPNIPSGVPKWSTGSGTKKSHMLWNFENVLSRQNWCVLVEGIFDALRMRDWAIAMLGKQPSDTQ